ncbi:MAG TPA: beta-ketoacyl synthase N-terminal-like domain-containing protein [Herpetosiphonaceae bacterium]
MSELKPTGMSNAIAIIGMAGRFPKAKNLHEFWNNLCAGVESISPISEAELIAEGVSRQLLDHPRYVKAGSIMDDVELFDADFFGINPREAELMDPQHRIFLECAWEALEDAGYNPETYDGAIGVFASSLMSSYLMANLYPHRNLLASAGHLAIRLANDRDFLPTRASYKLNLKGPSLCVQTACSSSLIATHLACQSLLDFQSDITLVGGVAINVPQKLGYFYQEGGIVSPDGHCRAFDANAQGTVYGNGIGVVALKRLEDALEDGDTIYAVIRGSAINNDGALKVGYTAPSVEGQAEVIVMAQTITGFSPETIGYIEAHGTGTPMGDPVEVAALTQVFREGTPKNNFCALGSVKTNLGHLDAAAGVAGLIKTALMLRNKIIPPSLNFETPNPEIDFANSPFYVNTQMQEWPAGATPRRAGVSSFAVGGTNAHIVLEEAPIGEPTSASRPWQIVMLSARTPTALEQATRDLCAHLQAHPEQDLADIAYTLQVGRKSFAHRRMVVCCNTADAAVALETLDPKRVFSFFQPAAARSVVFMFPGQGSQYIGMGRELYQTEPTFRQAIDRCATILRPQLGLDLREVLYPDAAHAESASQQLNQTALSQPALFVIEYALAQLWLEWGVKPRAMIGHSIGEYVAACLAGVFSLEDALSLVVLRGQLMQALPGGAMLSVSLPAGEVVPMLDRSLSLAASNSPTACVVSGSTPAIDAFEAQLNATGVASRRLHTSHAFHSSMMDSLVKSFAERVSRVKLNRPAIPYISNVTGTWITAAEATDPSYWANHLRQTVKFSQGIAEILKDAASVLLEVGPGRTLSTFAQQHTPGMESLVLTSLRHPQEPYADSAFLLQSLGKLWLAGAAIDWPGFYTHERRQRLPLPTYPFERQRYWIDPPGSGDQTWTGDELLEQEQALEQLAASTPAPPTQHSRPTLRNTYVAPTNAVEQALADLWQELIGVKQVGIHDNFFELGGHSLLAVQVASRIRDMFQVKLPLRYLFEVSTVAELAQSIETIRWAGQDHADDPEDTDEEREEIEI